MRLSVVAAMLSSFALVSVAVGSPATVENVPLLGGAAATFHAILGATSEAASHISKNSFFGGQPETSTSAPPGILAPPDASLRGDPSDGATPNSVVGTSPSGTLPGDASALTPGGGPTGVGLPEAGDAIAATGAGEREHGPGAGDASSEDAEIVVDAGENPQSPDDDQSEQRTAAGENEAGSAAHQEASAPPATAGTASERPASPAPASAPAPSHAEATEDGESDDAARRSAPATPADAAEPTEGSGIQANEPPPSGQASEDWATADTSSRGETVVSSGGPDGNLAANGGQLTAVVRIANVGPTIGAKRIVHSRETESATLIFQVSDTNGRRDIASVEIVSPDGTRFPAGVMPRDEAVGASAGADGFDFSGRTQTYSARIPYAGDSTVVDIEARDSWNAAARERVAIERPENSVQPIVPIPLPLSGTGATPPSDAAPPEGLATIDVSADEDPGAPALPLVVVVGSLALRRRRSR